MVCPFRYRLFIPKLNRNACRSLAEPFARCGGNLAVRGRLGRENCRFLPESTTTAERALGQEEVQQSMSEGYREAEENLDSKRKTAIDIKGFHLTTRLFLNLPVKLFVKTVIVRATFFTISVLFVALMLTSAGYSQGLMSKAMAIWLFDEDGGKKVSDYARNHDDGEFEDKPDWVAGKFGSALKFSSADENQRVDIGRPVVVDTVDFSIGYWLFPGAPQH